MKDKKKTVKLRKKNIKEKIRVLDNSLERISNKAMSIINELNVYIKTLPQDDKGNAEIGKDLALMYKHLTRVKVGLNTIKVKKAEDILGPNGFGLTSENFVTDKDKDETDSSYEEENKDVVILD